MRNVGFKSLAILLCLKPAPEIRGSAWIRSNNIDIRHTLLFSFYSVIKRPWEFYNNPR